MNFNIWTYFVLTQFSKKNLSKKLSGAHLIRNLLYV